MNNHPRTWKKAIVTGAAGFLGQHAGNKRLFGYRLRNEQGYSCRAIGLCCR